MTKQSWEKLKVTQEKLLPVRLSKLSSDDLGQYLDERLKRNIGYNKQPYVPVSEFWLNRTEFEGAGDITFIVVKMNLTIWFQIMEEAVCISRNLVFFGWKYESNYPQP